MSSPGLASAGVAEVAPAPSVSRNASPVTTTLRDDTARIETPLVATTFGPLSDSIGRLHRNMTPSG
jgi:hypothetical protein